MNRILADFIANTIILFTQLITAVQPRWIGCCPSSTVRVYYANHSSHGDSVLIWTTLPRTLRKTTRPVAGADYWRKNKLRKFIGCKVFRSVLIDRDSSSRQSDPIAKMVSAIQGGDSLIIFPEGTRNTTNNELLPFKSGIFHLAKRLPEIEFVPVWIANLNRVLPKGEYLPIPILCTVSFGTPLKIWQNESKNQFIERAYTSLRQLGQASNSEGHSSE